MRHMSNLGKLLLLVLLAFLVQACARTTSTPELSWTDTVTDTPPPLSSTPEQADSYQLPGITQGQINLREVNGFSDEFSTWYIYGLISNDTPQWVNDVVIEVALLDASGNQLYSDTANPAIHNLAPGESSPFILFSYEALNGVETIAAKILSYGTPNIERANLEFSGVTLWYDAIFNDVYISGNVTNSTTEPVQVNGIAASLHASDGTLASANTAYPFLYYLSPGISAPFRVMFDVPPGQGASFTDYMLYLDAQFTSAVQTLTLVPSQEHYWYLDAYEKFHLIGTLTNNTESYLNVRLVAGIYDDAGNCIDVASLYLPVAISPGGSLPYDFDLWGALDSSRDANQSATQYELYVDWYSTSEAYIKPVPITTQDNTNSFDGYSASFSGNVLNTAGRTLDSATVIVSLYDRTTGELIATDYTYVSGPLADGGLIPYMAYLYPEAEFEPANIEYTIYAFGQ
jgi:hypothetical protein